MQNERPSAKESAKIAFPEASEPQIEALTNLANAVREGSNYNSYINDSRLDGLKKEYVVNFAVGQRPPIRH
ncbi:hypothetical protein C5B42_02780 [Candidatus Cerribacteria bacterium 'Amazon FNV 2010 28 9']|uniref:Uncharacterized protein n=1 Tax=Candidatus Cerribacteria bacterium 'Amazon FNV 2010 28 9' TaxID=2081795 RepID=A0A317JNT8_9BACT|nr:MAG: hypothetical protein C5B42_02780 [Candidatus Cerribacteria bacterium 'Amazon FNV 2010 28 9']